VDYSRQDVLASLERLSEKAGAADELAGALEEALGQELPPDRAVFFLQNLARIYRDKIRRPDLAAASLRRLLDIDPRNSAALASLESYYREYKAFQDLAWVLSRQAELVSRPEERGDLLTQVAHIREEQLSDLEGAIAAYQQVLQANPEDLASLRQLDRLFQATGRWEDDARLLPRLCELSKNAAAVVEYLTRLAAIYVERLADPRQAVAINARVLELKPGHAEAISALEGLLRDEHSRMAAAEVLEGVYRQTSEWRKLTGILELRLGASADPAVRLALFGQLREIYELKIGEKALAFNVTARAFREMPQDEGVRRDLARQAAENGFFEELHKVYQDVAERLVGTDLAFDLRKQMARVLEQNLNRRAEAVQAWEKMLATRENDPEVLEALERLYREDGNFPSLVEVYRRQIQFAEDPVRRKDLLFQMAACLSEGVQDLDGAVNVYRQILDIDPSDRRALKLLEQLLAVGGRWPEVAEALQAQLDLLGGPGAPAPDAAGRVDLLLRLGMIRFEYLHDAPGALNTAQEAIQLLPGEPRVVEFLERLLGAEPTRGEAARLLEPSYRATGDFKKLVAVLEVHLASRQDPRERLSVFRQIMQLYEGELKQKPMAFAVAVRAFRENVADEGIRSDLERLAQETGSFEELAGVYEEAVSAAQGTAAGAILARRLAQLTESHLQAKDEAVSHWRQVLSADPDDLEALQALERLFRERGAFQELVGVLRHLAGLEKNPERRKDLYLEVAGLMEERLGHNDGAIDAYREILAEDPNDMAVVKLLDRLLERQGRHGELAEVLRFELERSPESELIPLFLRMARLQRFHLGKPEEAVAALAEVLKRQSAHPEALQELCAMFDSGEVRPLAARWMAEHLEAVGDYAHLAQALDVLADFSEEAAERKRHLLRLAALNDRRLGRKDQAFAALGRAFQEDPTDEKVRLGLERLAEDLGDWSGLAAVYSSRLEGLEDKGIVLILHRRLAGLYRERLGDNEKALAHLQAVAALDPKDGSSLMALEAIYRQNNQWDSLIDVLRKRSKLSPNLEQAAAVLYEVAGIQEQNLGDPGGAIATYREIAQLQPRDINALRMIDRLCQQQSRLKELAEVIVAEIKLLDALGDRGESLDLRFRLARLYEQEFGDLKRAGILYRDILQADPTHAKTIEHLESLQGEGRLFEGAAGLLEVAYERTGNWKKYVDILEQQVRQSRVMARRVELLQKIAQVQEQQLNLKSLAFNTWVRVFHEDLGSISAREQLERLAAEEENLEGLAAVYEEELDNIEDAVVGAAVAMKLAEIHSQTGGEWEDIVRFYKVATRFDGRNRAAWAALERLYGEEGRFGEQVDALSRLVDLVDDPSEQAGILFRLGSVLQDKLQDASRAVGYFRRVLDLSPGHLDSLRALEKAFAEQGNHEALFDTLKAHLEAVQDADERAELEARIADLAAGPLNRPDDAIALWQRALQADPRNREAFQALDRLFEKAGRWAELAAHIEAGMRQTNDPERIAALSSRLGWVKGEKLGELEDAMKHWQEVLRLDPKNQGALQALRSIYTSSGQWEQLLQVLRKLVPLQEDMLGVKQLRFQMAEILGEKLNRGDEAIEAAKRAQDIEPHSPEDLERLGRIFQANKAWSDAVTVLEQAADLKTVPADRIQALLDVAALWKERIGRPLGAAPAYEKILEIDPSHDEAFRAVQDIYQSGKEWRRLAALLEKRQAAIRERKDRVVLMKTIAEIYERHLGQKPIAFARYCAAFREDIADDEVLTKLEQLADEIEDYDTLLEVLEYAASEVGGGSRAVKLYQKIAGIHRNRLQQPEQAETFLRKAIALDRRDVTSLDALAELYRDADRISDLIQTLESKYDRSDTLEERKEILHQIARLQEERLSRIDLAVDTLKRILELDGRDTPAIQNLIRLYQQEAKWKELIQILRRAADQADDRGVTVNYLYNIAGIYETELQDDEQAIRSYQAVLEFEPTHLESLRALERLFTRLDRFSELLPVFEQQVQLIPEPREKIKILSKMGTIYEERFGNIETASACFERILELDPANLPAIKAQERLIRRLGDFNRLIDLYYRHIQLSDDRNEQVEIHLAIGDVWYRELSRVDKAEEVFAKALAIDPRSRPAIHALGQLYEKSGNWFNAIEMLSKEAELCGATPEAVDLYYRQGKINEDMLLDSQAAREAYSHALAIDPAYLPAIKALKLIYYLDKEYDRYLEMMNQEAEHTEDIEEKTRLYFEIGKFIQDQGDDTGRAAQAYEEALRLTHNYLPAAKPLADIYFRTEQWEQAETMMEVVVAGLDRNTESKELCRQYYRLGYITEKLGKEDRALEHYRTSYELDATYLPALEGLGNALLKAEKWEEAYRIYQTILIHHRNSLSDAEVAEIHWQIGDVNYRMGELDRAQASFKKALEIDAGHLASLQYLYRIAEERENWEEAYDFGTQMLEAMDGDELYEHYLRLAAMCREKLQDPFRAVDALLGAARVKPEALEPQTQLLALYGETRQFPKAVECLERIIQIEARPRLLVGYHQQAGQLLRDELRDDLRAVEHFNAALDLDPSAVQAFQAVVEILTRRKDWLQLRDNYIKMIKRLPVEARKTKLALWKDLGELCRVVLRNLNESIDAYRMIVTLDPEDVNSLATLGDLLAAKQGAADEAIAVHHKVLAASAERVASYRTLWKLYNTRKEYDKVYVLASILRYLKKADDEENKIVAYFSKKAPEMAGRAINDKLWEEYLAHPGVKVPFTRIFGLLYRVAPAMFLREHKDVGLSRREHQIDLARDRSLVAHNFRLAAKAGGGPEVELFALKDQEAPHLPGIALALTRPTAVIAYRDVFREDKKKHLLFYIGRELAMIRPEFILACALPLSRLNDLLQAVCLQVDPRHKAEGDPKEIERARAGLKRALREDGAGILQRAVADYLKNPRAYSLKNWLEAVEHSVNRCGFLVCNDIATAMGILKNEPAGITPMRPIQKIRELLVFMSSPEYLKLREVLALAVGS
jgi:tetratricopeptide (TPR) repeat protein